VYVQGASLKTGAVFRWQASQLPDHGRGRNRMGTAGVVPTLNQKRQVSLILWIGIVFVPIIFVWGLFRPGYSTASRVAGLGWMLIVLATISAVTSPPRPGAAQSSDGASSSLGADDALQHTKDAAALIAKMTVPQFLKDPSSASFGNVWGMGKDLACGFVNGKNSFGALTGQQRFIFAGGSVEFEGNPGFARHWNTLCVERLLSKAPVGVLGRKWGARPDGALKPYAQPGEGLAMYVPREAPAPLYGVPVKEADYRFDHNHLFAADLYIDGANHRDAIRAALEKAYGKPLDADDETHAYDWKWPERHVVIEMSFQDSSQRATVTFAKGDH